MRRTHDIGGKKVTFVNDKLLLKKGEYVCFDHGLSTTEILMWTQKNKLQDELRLDEQDAAKVDHETYVMKVVKSAYINKRVEKGHCKKEARNATKINVSK